MMLTARPPKWHFNDKKAKRFRNGHPNDSASSGSDDEGYEEGSMNPKMT
jgi:hypothetical protein